jgi:hypothetical protein
MRMKLAEALAERADAQRRLAQLKQRVMLSARFQEGEEPPEDPRELLVEADRIAGQLQDLIERINRTNATTAIQRDLYAETAQAASVRQDRYSRSEVKFVTALDVPELRRRADGLSKDYRELDARIQAKNWEIDLAE